MKNERVIYFKHSLHQLLYLSIILLYNKNTHTQNWFEEKRFGPAVTIEIYLREGTLFVKEVLCDGEQPVDVLKDVPAKVILTKHVSSKLDHNVNVRTMSKEGCVMGDPGNCEFQQQMSHQTNAHNAQQSKCAEH